jgi:hypothetical protein
MLDKIVKIDDYNLTLIFTDKPAFNIYCSEGDVLRLASWLLGVELTAPEETCTTLKVA